MTDQFTQIIEVTKGQHTSILKKMAMIESAKNGDPKPDDATPLGRAFRQYTYYKSGAYDEEFTRQISQLRPDWLEKKNSPSVYKQQIIEIAKKNTKKDEFKKHQLFIRFVSYTSKTSVVFDEDFTVAIKSIAPQWFVNKSEERISILVNMAKLGEPKPKRGQPLYSTLKRIISDTSSEAYQTIQKFAPDWF